MSDEQDNKSWLTRWLENIVPTTRMGQAMLAGIVVWFFNWIFSDGRAIFGSPVLKLVLDVASCLALIPLIYFLVKGAQRGIAAVALAVAAAVDCHLLFDRRFADDHVDPAGGGDWLLGALAIELGSVARQLDGYLEQSSTAAEAISRELSSEDLGQVDLAQLRQRLQNRANALSSVFPGLTLTLRGHSPQPFEISVTSSESDTSERDPLRSFTREAGLEYGRSVAGMDEEQGVFSWPGL